MLGTGFKNVLLFILIILILHFLIKNAILEKKGISLGFGKEHLTPENKSSDTKDNKKKNHVKTPDEHKQELFKYVMEDGEVEKFFEPSTHKELPEPNDIFETEYSIACDASNAVKETPVPKKKGKSPDDQDNNYLVIHQYKDESSLNGGKLLGGLHGYDSYLNNFQEYSCSGIDDDNMPPPQKPPCINPMKQRRALDKNDKYQEMI
jgi:hypothetical protein